MKANYNRHIKQNSSKINLFKRMFEGFPPKAKPLFLSLSQFPPFLGFHQNFSISENKERKRCRSKCQEDYHSQ